MIFYNLLDQLCVIAMYDQSWNASNDLDCKKEKNGDTLYMTKHPVDVHVGNRVRQRRWMLGITQQKLAETVGIKFQQIQKYETGANRISASRLWGIADSLQVPVSFFFVGLEDDTQTHKTEDSIASGKIFSDKEALELIKSYYAIPKKQRRHLFELARVLGKAA